MIRRTAQTSATAAQAIVAEGAGVAGNNYIGTNNLPALAAMVLPDGSSTRFTRYLLNPFDKPTQTIATYSKIDGSIGLRTNNFYYAANNIDLQQWVGLEVSTS